MEARSGDGSAGRSASARSNSRSAGSRARCSRPSSSCSAAALPGIGHGIHERDRGPRGRDRALGVAGQPGGVGQAAQQLDLVEILRPVFGCDLRPQRAGAVELAARGAEGIHPLGGGGGRDRGRERRRMPLGAMPVLGERGPFRGAARMPGRGCVERRGERGVHRPALAGQQLAVHRFTGERVAERVRLCSRTSTWASRSSCSAAPSASTSTPAADSSVRWSIPRPAVADDLSSRRAASDTPATRTSSSERSEAGSSGRGLAGRASGQQLLGEVRVALGARVHPRDQLPVRAAADDARDLQCRVGAGQRIEVEALRARAALSARPRARAGAGGTASSVRSVTSSSSRSSRRLRARKRSRSWVAPSAQWRSSTTSRTAPRRRDGRAARAAARTAGPVHSARAPPPVRRPARASAAPARHGRARATRARAAPRRSARTAARRPAPARTLPTAPPGPASRRGRRARAPVASCRRPHRPRPARAVGSLCRPLQRRLKHREDVVAADHPRA